MVRGSGGGGAVVVKGEGKMGRTYGPAAVRAESMLADRSN